MRSGFFFPQQAIRPSRAEIALGRPGPSAHIQVMLKFTPILLAILYAVAMYRFSAWRTARELDAKSTELADGRLKALTDRMAEALDLPRIRVNIYEIEPVNGLAAPDGRIFITRGFYNRYRAGEVTAEEMASVIAHELGHVALGHSQRRMIDFSGQNAIRTALAMVLSRFLPGIGPWIANALMKLLAARLSRGDEYEADAYAAALLHKSGIGVGPQKSLFTKLEKLTNNRGGAIPAWLLSHPKTEERIAALEALEARWANVQPR
ncbi:putative metalloprotease [Salipiger profundus]|jgi:putative metalloprotease|uniref:Putative metalloprotease n=2 Tax=Roseobacteraceae TaxID=2854170 RepID=A0A1U7D9J1_9RHOB|nr:putative metalloprotease [Salipiger profundus]SFC97760.1 putative metalloprotease [Salipiger profundus]